MHSKLILFLAFSFMIQVGEDEPVEPSLQTREYEILTITLNRQERDVLISTDIVNPLVDEKGVPKPMPPERNLLSMRVEPESFDLCLFGEKARGKFRQKELLDFLQTKVNLAVKENKLNDAERAKLELAGRGDIKRFYDRVEYERRKFEKNITTFNGGLRVLSELEPFLDEFDKGPFRPGSLFEKTLTKIKTKQPSAS